MRRYWLMDQHGGEGPTAMVQTDGSMRIVDVVRFGPGITTLEQQQEIWDRVIGQVAPTLKPLVDARSVEDKGIEPDEKLQRTEGGNKAGGNRPAASGRGLSAGRAAGSSTFKGRRGDR